MILALVLPVALQRVGVEESSAVQTHAAYHPVVKCALQHIHVLGIAVKQEQAVVGIDICYRGAGLAVTVHVGQVIVLGEPLTASRGAYASGQVHLLANHVIPNAVYGCHI